MPSVEFFYLMDGEDVVAAYRCNTVNAIVPDSAGFCRIHMDRFGQSGQYTVRVKGTVKAVAAGIASGARLEEA